MAGIGLGAAYGVRLKKGAAPMIVAGLGGSLADIIYGYTVACQDEVQAYNNHQSYGGSVMTTATSADKPPPDNVG